MSTFVRQNRFSCFITFLLLLGILLGSATASYPKSEPSQKPLPKPKYIFLFIGDGMGMAQRMATEHYLAAKAGKSLPSPNDMRMTMNQLPVQSPTTTFSASSFVTDSAASGTAIACGMKTKNHYLGTAPDLKFLVSIAEAAHEQGYRVGLLSSVPLDHATPAAFYANIESRYQYGDIPLQLIDSNFEYFAGGGLLGNRKVKSGSDDFFTQIENNGIKVTKTFEDLKTCKPGERVYAYTGSETLPWSLNEPDKADYLAKFTEEGIRLLDNPNGFFMMVEGGMIDWAGHGNDAGAIVNETIALDKAVTVAYDFLEKHPDETLILVTADHETGGLTIGSQGVKPEILCKQSCTVAVLRQNFKKVEDKPFEDVLPLVTEFFGGEENLSKNDRDHLAMVWNAILAVKNAPDKETKKKIKDENRARYGRSQPDFVAECVRLRDQASGIFFSHSKHTCIPIITSAAGVGQDLFNGPLDNSDIAKKIGRLIGVQLPIVQEKKEEPAKDEEPAKEKVLQKAS